MSIKFTPDHKNRFDEMYLTDVKEVQAEIMSKKGLCLCFSLADGQYVQFWVNSDKELNIHHEVSEK